MNRSILLAFVAVQLLASSSMAHVVVMWSGNDTANADVYGCVKFNYECTDALFRNRCCPRSACECDGNNSSCRCIPTEDPPSTCAASGADCDIRKGCCDGRDGCDCTGGTSCTCQRHTCLWENVDCSARRNGCCNSLDCKCSDPQNCKCAPKPPPPPPSCLLRRQACDPNNDRCCSRDYCANNQLRGYQCWKKGLVHN